MKSYETELVSIPAKTKWLYICLSTIGAVVGIGIFVNSVGTDSTDKAPGVIWGLIIAALGVFLLVQAVRKTHERVITAAGKAAMALKLYNCVVADVKNWSCSISSEKDAPRIGMRDGDFTYDPSAMYIPGLRFVSRREYLIVKYTSNGK
jgi:hypothetical protein